MTAVLVFDGDCGFCTSSATWIADKWKSPATATAIAWQRLGDGGLEELGLTLDEVAGAAWWVNDDQRSGGHLAVAHALAAACGGWGLLGRVLLVAPVRPFAAVGYRLVARYRYRLPGGTPAGKI
jgi:predicted DCC family thiol-disulfide oxidoreductase YuxK